MVDNGSSDGTPDVSRRSPPRSEPPTASTLSPTRSGVPLRNRAPPDPGRLGAQPHLLLQLGVLPGAHHLLAEMGRRHAAHRGRRTEPSPTSPGNSKESVSCCGCLGMGYTWYRTKSHGWTPTLQNREPWGWPNREGLPLRKGFRVGDPAVSQAASAGWTSPTASASRSSGSTSTSSPTGRIVEFGETVRTARKQRELAVFEDLTVGRKSPGLIPFGRGDRPHVIDAAQRITRAAVAVDGRRIATTAMTHPQL